MAGARTQCGVARGRGRERAGPGGVGAAARGHALLGCHMGEVKIITGGALGKVSGNLISALKKPPSLRGEGGGAGWVKGEGARAQPLPVAAHKAGRRNAHHGARGAHHEHGPVVQVVVLQPHGDALGRALGELCEGRMGGARMRERDSS